MKARMLGRECHTADIAQKRIGYRRPGAAARTDDIGRRTAQQRASPCLLAVPQSHMTYLMTDDTQQFVVIEHVHQSRKHTHTAVGTSESISLAGDVDLEIEFDAIGTGHATGEALESFGIGIAGTSHLIRLVHLGNRLSHRLGQVLVGDGSGLACLQQP